MRLAVTLAITFTLVPSIAAPADYDFCVTRVSPTGSDSLRTRLQSDIHEHSREALGQLLVRHYRQPPDATIRVEDYRSETCAASDTQFLTLNGTLARDAPVRQVPAVPDIADGANLAAKIITSTYMELTMQAIGALGSLNGAAHQIICGMVKC